MRLLRVLGPLLLLVVAGCGKQQPIQAKAPVGNALEGHTFLSVEVSPHQLVADTRISLRFTDDGRLLADAGCNSMQGPVTVDNGKLVVDGLATTDMGCDQPRHAQDNWLAGVIDAQPAWHLDGPRLELSTPDAKLVLEDREVAEPDLALVDTVWTVDTIVSGTTASSTTGTATLVFKPDVVEINGGCNTGSTDYRLDGDQIEFGDAVMTRMACAPEITELETAVLDVVRDKVTFEIEANRLTLTHPAEKGLGLAAE